MNLSAGDVRGATVALLGTGVEARAAYPQLVGEARRPLLVLDDNRVRALAFAEQRPGVIAVNEARLLAVLGAAPAGERVILRAPGAPPCHPVLASAREAGTPHTTFTGLWLAANRDRIAATITGTKGKSTTTRLLASLLSAAGRDCDALGNIGVAPAAAIADGWTAALELSSYQLHDIPAAAGVHVVTSLYREHLDWHRGYERYWRDKCRPFALDEGCIGVLGEGVEWIAERFPNRFVLASQVVRRRDDGWSVCFDGAEARIPAGVLAAAPPGDGFTQNLGVAIAAALTSGGLALPEVADAVERALIAWEPMASRQQLIGRFGGRDWVDDALATIPEATLDALAGLAGRPVRLVLGGRDRGQDFTDLAAAVRERRDVTAYAYGPTAEKLADAFGEPLATAPDFEALLEIVYAASAPGDVILFSPAAATHEPGENFENRQRRFAAFARAHASR